MTRRKREARRRERQDRLDALAAREAALGDYMPTADEIETCYGDRMAELAAVDDSIPSGFRDFAVGWLAFQRWLAARDESVRQMEREALHSLHREARAVFSWRDGMRYDDPCADCHGAPGVHECGCWGDVQIEYVCAECHRLGGSAAGAWPCPTAIATGLTADPEADQ